MLGGKMSKIKNGILNTVMIAAALAVIVYGLVFTSKLNMEYSYAVPESRSEQIYSLSGWQYCWGDSPINSDGGFAWMDSDYPNDGWIDFNFPGRPENTGGYHSVWVRAVLPDTHLARAFFRFRSPQNTAEVYLDNELIYSYGVHDTTEKVRTPGSTWHFVKLPNDYAGKTIYIRLSSPFPHMTGYLTQVAVGHKGPLYMDIFIRNMVQVLFGTVFVFVGLIILLFQLITQFKRNTDMFLGLGTAFLGGWMLMESNFHQLFVFSPVSSTYFANFFIFLTPVWLLIYIERTYITRNSIQSRLMRLQAIVHSTFAVISFTLDFAGIVSILYCVRIFHLLFAISSVISIFAAVKSALEGKKQAGVLVIGILALVITGTADTFSLFYDTSPLLKFSSFSLVGMLIFITVLMINAAMDLKRFYSQIERRSKETETNYKSLFTNMKDGFTLNRLEYDDYGHLKSCTILEANDAFAEKVGISRKELIGTDILWLFPELRALCLEYQEVMDETASVSEFNTADDAVRLMGRWYRLSVFYPKRDFISIIFSDVTVMKDAEETIRRQAYTDSMTGFCNRTFFEEEMSRMNEKLSVLKPISIIVIDIDGLKITNDTFGHNAGDELLIKAADIIRSAVRSHGTISRIGGDEFCILLPNTDQKTAQEKAEAIVKITDLMNGSNTLIPISMSVGLATSGDDDDEDIYSIYRRADDDMYRYKISQSSSEKSKVIDMLLSALSERDYVTQGHVERISGLCIQMADALDLHDNQKRNLILLSKVHDLGKIGIPDDILNKPSKLTEREYEKMKTHVKVGFNIANRSKELVLIAPLILHHHEFWDGNGYPSGLKGEEIPLECRILGIIDAFDAMTNDRPYHKGISMQEAIEEIRRCAGKQFDPFLSEKFIEIITRNNTGGSSQECTANNDPVDENAAAQVHGSAF
jgi:diguanylate cyclase (GGDEF)-like protein